jgi:cold shock protein
LVTGRILQFDQSRGYGFVAAEDGGEDIFLHASVLQGDPDLLIPGTMVEFQVMAGDRGRKAFNARLTDEETDTRVPIPGGGPVPGPPPPMPTGHVLPQQDEDQMCDVLSAEEFRQELTELLLNAVPELTGQQIVQVRRSLLDFAKEHGWSDG